jgi:hypothetical protein
LRHGDLLAFDRFSPGGDATVTGSTDRFNRKTPLARAKGDNRGP